MVFPLNYTKVHVDNFKIHKSLLFYTKLHVFASMDYTKVHVGIIQIIAF